MTTLRERVVEAMAPWVDVGDAEAALDAMLDCLPHRLGDVTVEDLVAELREDR